MGNLAAALSAQSLSSDLQQYMACLNCHPRASHTCAKDSDSELLRQWRELSSCRTAQQGTLKLRRENACCTVTASAQRWSSMPVRFISSLAVISNLNCSACLCVFVSIELNDQGTTVGVTHSRQSHHDMVRAYLQLLWRCTP